MVCSKKVFAIEGGFVMGTCVICNKNEGESFAYYTAKRINSEITFKDGQSRQTSTYTNLTLHSDCVCKSCRKKHYRPMFTVCAIITVILGLISFGPWRMTLVENCLNLWALCLFLFIPSLILTACTLVAAPGSQVLIKYYSKKNQGDGLSYFTPENAKKLKRK